MKRRKERRKEGNKREEIRKQAKVGQKKTIWKLYFHFAQQDQVWCRLLQGSDFNSVWL